jgi:hypothetical protein
VKTVLAASLAVLALALPAAAQDMSKVEIKTTKLSDTVYMMVGSGGNLALSAGADQTFLVDDQFAPLTPKITAAIAAVTPKAVAFVLNRTGTSATGGSETSARPQHRRPRQRAGAWFGQLIGFQVFRDRRRQTKIIPGTGRFLSNKAELKAYRDMLETVSGHIRQLIKDGRKFERSSRRNRRPTSTKWGGFIRRPSSRNARAQPAARRE